MFNVFNCNTFPKIIWTVDEVIGLWLFPPCAVLILWPSTYKHCSANKYLKLSDEKEMYKDRKLYHSSSSVCTVRYFPYAKKHTTRISDNSKFLK